MSDKKKRVIEFFKKQGLFIALIICVIGIAVAAVVSASSKPGAIDPGVDVQKQESPRLSDEIAASPSASAAASPSPSASPTASASASAAPYAPQQAADKLTAPVKGTIIKAFSGDKLVYNATLNMWMTHNGIDISCTEGTDICAALAGEISDVTSDSQKNVCITITHSGEQQTVYAGLKSAAVKAGDRVNAGSVIGNAGIPAFESSEGAHLHFEYIVKGAYQDPVKRLGE